MRTLITGAAGFIGRNLRPHLLCDGHELAFVDSLDAFGSIREWEKIRKIHPEFLREYTSINSHRTTALLSQFQPESIVHLAATPGVRDSWEPRKYTNYTRANCTDLMQFLEACRGLKSLKTFVFASSSTVYGVPPVGEGWAEREGRMGVPKSPYGATKRFGEDVCEMFFAGTKTKVRVARIFSALGRGIRRDLAPALLARACFDSNQTFNVLGSLEQTRDWTHVSDICRGLVQMAEREKGLPFEVYNLSARNSTSLQAAIDMVTEAAGRAPKLAFSEAHEGDPQNTKGDNRKALKVLGWAPKKSIREGFSDVVAEIQEEFPQDSA